MTVTKPIFRIFDYTKAVEFYIHWLGFVIDWEHRPDASPIYMQVSKGGIVLHLSEHHGDCTPGSRLLIEGFDHLPAYHQQLTDSNYTYNRPGIHHPFYDKSLWEMEVTDPFGNRLTFTGK